MLLLCGCEKQFVYPNYIKNYVYDFELQAKLRGVGIDYNGLQIELSKTNLEAYYDPNKHKIIIDTTSWNWKNAPEELIAHEMGHAILKREHDWTRLKNGMYKSVMGNNAKIYYAGWTRSTNKITRKKYYYDELFNPNTKDPGDIR